MIADEIDGLLMRDGAPLPVVASIFTPYQLLFLERILALVAPRPVLILDSRPERFRAGRPPRIADAATVAVALTGKATDRRESALILDAIVTAERFAGGRPFAFLNASMQWPINNIFYTRHRRDPDCRLILIEDGLSTYLSVTPPPRERLRNLAREGAIVARGLPRRTFLPGHPLGLDVAEVAGIVIGADRRPPGDGRRRYVTLSHDPATAPIAYTPDAALFVGQPYLGTFGAQVLEPLIAAIVRDLRARGYRRLGFKAHHYQTEAEAALYLAHGFERVESVATVEEMFAASSFRTIAAINSTALLTTRSLYGDGVRAIAYAPTRFPPRHERRDMAEVEAVFRRAGVEIVDPAMP